MPGPVALAEVGHFTLYQVDYVQETHSAAAQEDNWDAIAKFLIEGEQDDFTQSPLYRKERRLGATVFGGKLTAIVVWSLIFGVYGIYLASAALISFFVQNYAAAEIQLFLSVGITLAVTYKILTKV